MPSIIRACHKETLNDLKISVDSGSLRPLGVSATAPSSVRNSFLIYSSLKSRMHTAEGT